MSLTLWIVVVVGLLLVAWLIWKCFQLVQRAGQGLGMVARRDRDRAEQERRPETPPPPPRLHRSSDLFDA